MLRLAELTAGYGAAPVLRGVSLRVEKGESVALLGPNGAGKSTLLAAITGTIAHRQGSIRLEGKELAGAKSHAIVAGGVALVPEGRLVFAPFSVEDNLRLGAIRLKGSLEERLGFVYGLFPKLAERRRQAAGTLSGGEQQMLAIGRALMTRPRLLMLDEPSQGIMPKLVDEIFQAVKRIRDAGMTVLIVEQRVTECLEIADRAYILQTGRVLMQGSAADISVNPDVRKAYLGL